MFLSVCNNISNTLQQFTLIFWLFVFMIILFLYNPGGVHIIVFVIFNLVTSPESINYKTGKIRIRNTIYCSLQLCNLSNITNYISLYVLLCDKIALLISSIRLVRMVMIMSKVDISIKEYINVKWTHNTYVLFGMVHLSQNLNKSRILDVIKNNHCNCNVLEIPFISIFTNTISKHPSRSNFAISIVHIRNVLIL